MIAEYLTAAVEDENPDMLLLALANVAKARGMSEVARAAGLGRESLYKTLAPGAKPRFATIHAVLRASNIRLSLLRPEPTRLAKAKRAMTAIGERKTRRRPDPKKSPAKKFKIRRATRISKLEAKP